MFYIDVFFPIFSFVFPLWILWITQWISLFFNIFQFFSSWITVKSYTPTLCSFLRFVNLCIFHCLFCTISGHILLFPLCLPIFWKYFLLSDNFVLILTFYASFTFLFAVPFLCFWRNNIQNHAVLERVWKMLSVRCALQFFE